VLLAKRLVYAMPREDLAGHIEALRKLPKDHKIKTNHYGIFKAWKMN